MSLEKKREECSFLRFRTACPIFNWNSDDEAVTGDEQISHTFDSTLSKPSFNNIPFQRAPVNLAPQAVEISIAPVSRRKFQHMAAVKSKPCPTGNVSTVHKTSMPNFSDSSKVSSFSLQLFPSSDPSSSDEFFLSQSSVVDLSELSSALLDGSSDSFVEKQLTEAWESGQNYQEDFGGSSLKHRPKAIGRARRGRPFRQQKASQFVSSSTQLNSFDPVSIDFIESCSYISQSKGKISIVEKANNDDDEDISEIHPDEWIPRVNKTRAKFEKSDEQNSGTSKLTMLQQNEILLPGVVSNICPFIFTDDSNDISSLPKGKSDYVCGRGHSKHNLGSDLDKQFKGEYRFSWSSDDGLSIPSNGKKKIQGSYENESLDNHHVECFGQAARNGIVYSRRQSSLFKHFRDINSENHDISMRDGSAIFQNKHQGPEINRRSVLCQFSAFSQDTLKYLYDYITKGPVKEFPLLGDDISDTQGYLFSKIPLTQSNFGRTISDISNWEAREFWTLK